MILIVEIGNNSEEWLVIAVFKIVGTAAPRQPFDQVCAPVFNQLFLSQIMSDSLDSSMKI